MSSSPRWCPAFPALWSLCLFADVSNHGLRENAATPVVALLASVVLAFPGRSAPLVAACLAHLAAIALRAPERLLVHWWLDALVEVLVLLTWANEVVRRRSPLVPADVLVARLAPAGRVVGLIAVAAAGLAKLNSMFLDPAVSCASALYLRQAAEPWVHGLLPDATWSRDVAIWLCVITENTAPTLLLFRRTRPLGAILLAALFLLLGINPAAPLYEFTGPVVALLLLFSDVPVPALPRWTAAIALLAAVAGLAWGDGPADLALRTALWRLAWGAAIPVALAVYLRKNPPVDARARLPALLRGGAALSWLVPAVLLVNEAAVYLGFPHYTAFMMASDLRILRGLDNHVLFTPPRLPLNGGVQIVSSSDPYLRGIARHKSRINELTLRWALSADPNARASFRIDGGPIETLDRAGDDPRFQAPPPLADWLRYSQPPLTEKCSHWERIPL